MRLLRFYGRKLIRKCIQVWPNMVIILLSVLITLLTYIIMQDIKKANQAELELKKNGGMNHIPEQNKDVKPWVKTIKSEGKLTWSLDQFEQNKALLESKGPIKENDVLPPPIKSKNQPGDSIQIIGGNGPPLVKNDKLPLIGGNPSNGKFGAPMVLGRHVEKINSDKGTMGKEVQYVNQNPQQNQVAMIGRAKYQQYGQDNQQVGQSNQENNQQFGHNNQQFVQNNQQFGQNNQQFGQNNQQFVPINQQSGQNYQQIGQVNKPQVIKYQMPPNRAQIAETNQKLNHSDYWIDHVALHVPRRAYYIGKSEKAKALETSKTDDSAETAYFDWLMEKQLGCLSSDLLQFGNGVNQWAVCNTGKLALEQPCIVYSFGKTDFDFENVIGSKFGCQVHVFDTNIENLATHTLLANTRFYALGLWDDDIDTRDVQDVSLNQLSTVIKQTGHRNMMIDLLKIDIDHILWTVLPSIKQGCWKRFKQLIFRVYGPGDGYRVPAVHKMYKVLSLVEKFGFLKYNVQPCSKQKFVSKFTNREVPPCWDLSYVNNQYIG